ncbi:MAG: PD40 domain-containing protein [Bacteroidales bacterium]|nr:PD40 domain-containing protein [Bacteroidales bacterium]
MNKYFLLASLLFCLSMAGFSQEESRLLRFPTLHGNHLVFSYAGDLYEVAASGGIARKLTNDPGYEMFSKYSPDGSQIAFTAQYDGNTEVYVMPATGGIPKRLTITATLGRDDISDRMGPNNIVMAWSPDGKSITYRSRKQSYNDFVGQLFTVPVEGGLSTELPLPAGGFCSWSADGKKLAYNRVFREFRTWKYYKGGMADDIWIYDFPTKKLQNITNHGSQDIFPMWFGNEIYFCSDRDRIMNLFCYNISTGSTRKVTNFTDYDIKFPSAADQRITFEQAGFIHIFDIATQTTQKVSIEIKDDFIGGRAEYKDATRFLGAVNPSPDGNRIVATARGDIFSVPVKEGITRNLTGSNQAHDRDGAWSPDGKWIAYLSDINGEYEIYIQKQDGSEPPVQLTTGADTYKFTFRWSPDSKKILWNDKMMRLQYIDIETKKVTLVDKSKLWEYGSFDWSPDSKWICYSQMQPNRFNQVILYQLETARKIEVTDQWFNSDQATFSRDGKYLVFVSDRTYNPTYSAVEWNYAYENMSKIYLVALAADTPSPFALSNDEVKMEEAETPKEEDAKGKGKESKSKKADKEKAETEKPKDIKVDEEGIQQRIVELPVKASNYFNLWAIDDKVYYNEASGEGFNLKLFDLKAKKETEIGNNMVFDITTNGKKMLIRQNNRFYMIDLPSSKVNLDKSIEMNDVKMWVDYRLEWKQIYDEAWRQMRDFFYVPNMHGVDWKSMYEKYAVMLPYVNHRNDLTYLIGEMIGELNVGHAYIGGGERPSQEKIDLGLLGARLSRDASGYYRIDSLMMGENWARNLRSPLTMMGVGAKKGDFITSVNGKSTKDMADINQAFINKAGKNVEITLNSAPEAGGRKVLINPIRDESQLYYYTWVQNNIRKVNEATNGEVGYLHVPDMSAEGLNEFVKYFYPQLSKKALIIDDRGNGGGNVSPMLIERLQREITRSNTARNVELPGQTPQQMMLGPKVLLINNYSASDGDLFPYAFKKHQLGKVIGVRSWGGVVGIRGSLPFIDGADLRKPEFASYSAEESKWIIEGHGVDPDIIVDNDPALEYQGIDEQLNKAIEVIREELKNYKDLPAIPAGPDKTK